MQNTIASSIRIAITADSYYSHYKPCASRWLGDRSPTKKILEGIQAARATEGILPNAGRSDNRNRRHKKLIDNLERIRADGIDRHQHHRNAIRLETTSYKKRRRPYTIDPRAEFVDERFRRARAASQNIRCGEKLDKTQLARR